MNVEIMLYVYLFVCVSMIAFNIVMAIVFREKDKRIQRVSRRFSDLVAAQLEAVRNGGTVDQAHQKRLKKSLRRIGNMAAFDDMLEKVYRQTPELAQEYLRQLDDVFIVLTAHYGKKDAMEAAYFPYIIKKYRLIEGKHIPKIEEAMFSMLSEPSLYARENALQALYTTGDPATVIRALKILNRSELFLHGKILTDGLLNFSGETDALIKEIMDNFSSFGTEMQVSLLNYIRLSSGGYGEFMLGILRNQRQNHELRYCAIRYFGKYYDEAAYDVLCELACDASKRWEYAAIASSALGNYPDKATMDILKKNLSSKNWYIRYNSAASLERLGATYYDLIDVFDGDDRYASEILHYTLERGKKSEEVAV